MAMQGPQTGRNLCLVIYVINALKQELHSQREREHLSLLECECRVGLLSEPDNGPRALGKNVELLLGYTIRPYSIRMVPFNYTKNSMGPCCPGLLHPCIIAHPF